MPKQDVAVELYYDGAWHDVAATDDVYTDPPITISHGGGEEGAVTRPNRITLSLANDDDMYRPTNPLSVLYGKVGLNTPTRVKVGDTVRGIGEASFESAQSNDFRASPRRGKAWVEVDAAGLSQRIAQWTEPLRSAFRQFNETVDSVGYWSGEQDRGSTSLDSGTPGVSKPTFVNVAPDSQFRPPGSAPLLDMGENSEAGAFFAQNGSATSTDGWQLSWVARYPGLVAGEQDIFDWQTTDRTGYGLYLNPTTGNIIIYSIDDTGTQILHNGSSYGSYDWSQWTLFSIDAQYSAGTTRIWVNWSNSDGTQAGFMNPSFTGVPASLQWWDLSVFAGVPKGSTFGHVLGTYGSSLVAATDLFGTSRKSAWSGYLDELAADRFARLCALKGVLCYVSNGYAKSTPMGPQGVDTLLGQFQEIAETDDALIFDHGTEQRLYMLCGTDRLNQTPSLTLDADNDTHLSIPPREKINDLDPHNVVTASQRDGGAYTVEDDSSPKGSQPPPDGAGEYKQTLDVNVADEATQLPHIASWGLAKGTNPRPRFPTVVVDLVAAPELIPAVEATDTGSVIEIVNYREYTIRGFVLGWVEVIGTHSRTVTFTCAPDDVFNAGVLDTARLQARSTTLNADITAAATSLTLKSTDNLEVWRTGSNGVPVLIGGELITLGTVAARSGSGPWTQAVTGCTRAVNGIGKAHSAGDPVTVQGAIRVTLRG